MKVTYLGTTMLLFDDGQCQLLFDCHITRPSLLRCGFGRFSTNIEVADRVMKDFSMDRLAAIFISHTHHDHVMDAPYFANKTGAVICGSASAKNVAIGGGIPSKRFFCYDDAKEYYFGNFKVTVIPSIHSIAHWYNNDLGQTINTPLIQPAKKKAYKEGGSYDFLVEHENSTYLIRPSYNFLPGQLDHIQTDVFFLGIGGLSKDTAERKARFYAETLDKVEPKIVIPVHWDNFFVPLYEKDRWMTGPLDNPMNSLNEIKTVCEQKGIRFILQMPLTNVEF